MVTVNEILEGIGIDTAGMPRSSTASSNLSMYEDLISTVGNPVFLLQQGLTTPAEFQQTMRMLTSEQVPLEDFDFGALEEVATSQGDDEAAVGYGLIKSGYTVDQALRAAKRANEDADVDLLRADLELFKSRWDNANNLENDLLMGNVQEVNGQLLRRMSNEDAMQIYKAVGLPDYLQNPILWDTIPDPEILGRAAAGEKEAADIARQLSRASRTSAKEATSTAQDVYEQMKAKAAFGVAAGGMSRTAKETRKEYEESVLGPTTASKAAASPPVAGGKPSVSKEKASAKPLAAWIVKKFAEIQGGKDSTASILGRLTPAEQEAAAKAAAVYTGKSEMATDPKLKALRNQLASKETSVQNLKSQAVQKGTIPGLQLLQQGMPIASLLSTPQPKAQAVKPAPRVLSDQEIQTMANMIAGGIV